MSLWNRIKKSISDTVDNPVKSVFRDASRYAFIDVEVGLKDHRIHDIGALRWDRAIFHSANKRELLDYLKDVDFVCGHNIIHHDAKYLFGDVPHQWMLVDTLYVSPLLFPEKPYHHLLKDDKLISDQINNPVNDCEKAYDLLMDEVARWSTLSEDKKSIYATLLDGIAEFEGFLQFVNANVSEADDLANLILFTYQGKICEHADIENIITQYPCEHSSHQSRRRTVLPAAFVPRQASDVRIFLQCAGRLPCRLNVGCLRHRRHCRYAGHIEVRWI